MTEPEMSGEAVSPSVNATARPARQNRATVALLMIAAFVAVGGIGFALGKATAPSSTGVSNLPAQPGALPGTAGGNALPGSLTGTVLSISGSTMTIRIPNGTVVTVNLSGSTTYHREVSASSSDIRVGRRVVVQLDASAKNESPNPSASGTPGGRTPTAKDVLITQP